MVAFLGLKRRLSGGHEGEKGRHCVLERVGREDRMYGGIYPYMFKQGEILTTIPLKTAHHRFALP